MILSMTGYGRKINEFKDRTIIIEVRSLNSKYADVKTKIPQKYRGKELEIQKIAKGVAQRGKVDVTIEIKEHTSEAFTINRALFKAAYRELESLCNDLKISKGDIVSTIMKQPNVVLPAVENITTEEWTEVKTTLNEALAIFNEFRLREGKGIKDDFELRAKRILNGLEEIIPHEGVRLERLRQRLLQNLKDSGIKDSIDANRFEQEMLYYMEKLDITEEKVRLKEHCGYFLKQLETDVVAKGRKLNFMVQEMGREINTLGSKASYSPIQHLVVQMKDELEKIKEQLANTL